MLGELVVSDAAEARDRQRVLLPRRWKTAGLAVSGTRGVACVLTSNHRFQLFDLAEDEEAEEEEEEEGAEEEEEEGGGMEVE